MEPQVIETILKRLRTAEKEVEILYELSESEMMLLVALLMQLPVQGMSTKLSSKLLRAAAHFVESSSEIADGLKNELKRKE